MHCRQNYKNWQMLHQAKTSVRVEETTQSQIDGNFPPAQGPKGFSRVLRCRRRSVSVMSHLASCIPSMVLAGGSFNHVPPRFTAEVCWSLLRAGLVGRQWLRQPEQGFAGSFSLILTGLNGARNNLGIIGCGNYLLSHKSCHHLLTWWCQILNWQVK